MATRALAPQVSGLGPARPPTRRNRRPRARERCACVPRAALRCDQTSGLRVAPGALAAEAGRAPRRARGASLRDGTALPASGSGSDSDASSSPSSSSELQLLGSLSPSSAPRDLEVSSSYSSFSLLKQRGQCERRSETTHHLCTVGCQESKSLTPEQRQSQRRIPAPASQSLGPLAAALRFSA